MVQSVQLQPWDGTWFEIKRGIVAHQRQLSHSYWVAGSVLMFVEGRAAASSNASLAPFCPCENPRH